MFRIGYLPLTLPVVIAVLALLASRSGSPPPPPTALHQEQLTNNGAEKRELLDSSDGIFFAEVHPFGDALFRLLPPTGRVVPVSVPALKGRILLSAVADRLLLADTGSPGSLWEVSIVNGNETRLPIETGPAAAWSPNGKSIVYADDRAVYLADRLGRHPKVLASRPAGHLESFRWSPDGSRIRFLLADVKGSPYRFWEVNLSSGNLAQVRSAAKDDERESKGEWTTDGRYFVSVVHSGSVGRLWAERESRPGFPWQRPQPFLINTSLASIDDIAFRADGKKLYVLSRETIRSEVLRYEDAAHVFALDPVMVGISAGHLQYSPDGKWIVYMTHPASELWVMRRDGSDKRKLLPPQHHGALPQWSPDSRQITFIGWEGEGANQPSRASIISLETGVVRQVPATPYWQGGPVWSTDGSQIFFGENGLNNPIPGYCRLHRFDLKTDEVINLPNTTGLWTARTSPTGHYVAAMTPDNHQLVLYDLRTAARTVLASFSDIRMGDNPCWSHDGKYLYFDTVDTTDPAVFRLRIADRQRELVASLKNIQRAHGDVGAWIGLTPNDKVMVLRQSGASELYSFDWVAP
jgi:Tol biopolymer transport system component